MGVCRCLPCPEMYVPRAGVGGLGRENSDLCLTFGITSWLMPLRDRSGLTSQPFWHGKRGRSGPSLSRLMGVCRELRCTHSTYMFNEACLGSLVRLGLIGLHPVPSIWFPFHPFPLHTPLFSSFLSCPPVFMSFISSFLSFARTLVPALACTCTTTCT